MKTADVVICGAGIAGISAAYYLAAKHGIKDVAIVDYRPPLTFTSDKSTECYRNWWPGPGDTMVRFMNRSIDLLEQLADESDNYFGLNRRGYVFLTADPERARSFVETAKEISTLGAGSVRSHESDISAYQTAAVEGYKDQPIGADIVLGSKNINAIFPFLANDVVAMMHPRRCGWLSAQQLGMYLLDKAREHGVRLIEGKITAVETKAGQISAATVSSSEGTKRISTNTFVNAAGPYIDKMGQLFGVKLPVFNELHGKISFNDTLGLIPRDVPMMIWSDPVTLPWTREEREDLASYDETRWLTQTLPAGVHFRPEGLGKSSAILMLWTYDLELQDIVWPPTFDQSYPEIVMRGLTRMVPSLSAYIERMGKPWVDGGYYCKTQENRPLIGPLPVPGSYIIGALSGYGIMASQAAAELLSMHITGADLPDYAPQFMLERYEDPAYQTLLEQWDATSGQL